MQKKWCSSTNDLAEKQHSISRCRRETTQELKQVLLSLNAAVSPSLEFSKSVEALETIIFQKQCCTAVNSPQVIYAF